MDEGRTPGELPAEGYRHEQDDQAHQNVANGTEADFNIDGDDAAPDVVFAVVVGVFGVLPVPGGIRVAGKDDRVVVLAVLRQQLAVDVLGFFLPEQLIEPGVIQEHRADDPHPAHDHGEGDGEPQERPDLRRIHQQAHRHADKSDLHIS